MADFVVKEILIGSFCKYSGKTNEMVYYLMRPFRYDCVIIHTIDRFHLCTFLCSSKNIAEIFQSNTNSSTNIKNGSNN